MEFGLNLYSIRTLIGTEEQYLDTCLKLKDMGYGFVQFSGAKFDAGMIRRVATESGLPVCLTHVSQDRILNDTDRLMEEHESFGCHNIGLGSLSKAGYADENSFKQTVDMLAERAAYMKKNGFEFFYHHHNIEFIKFGEKTGFDYIVENAPEVNITLDTYWLQCGGADVCETIKKLKGRIVCSHLKDYMMVKTEDWCKNVFAPVGDGNLDFKKIIPLLRESGSEYCLVEQDNAVDFANPLDQVKRSIDYLKNLNFR